MKFSLPVLLLLFIFLSCRKDDNPLVVREIIVDSMFINNVYAPNNSTINSVNFVRPTLKVVFNQEVDTSKFVRSKLYINGGVDTAYSHRFDNTKKNLYITPIHHLNPLSGYRPVFDVGETLGGINKSYYSFIFRTRLDSTPKFPAIPDEELLTLIQRQTFKYFWNYAHPFSGLARERKGSGNVVTIGGSGFGLMSILVGIERNFITRQEGFERINTIVNFLNRTETDKFHGVFPHWLHGATGKVIPFSPKDNGGDLVETAFLMQGLLTVKEYFKGGSPAEAAMCSTIQVLWENVEWAWYRKNQENVLYWHWSPNYGWEMNHPIRGWNEALIVYVLAASSPTYPITKPVYEQGWARNGGIINNRPFYGINLPLGEDYGGPLFFSHYSFLGLDPRNLADQYANYWSQLVAHSKINHSYCRANPRGYVGYSSDCWGLTASDIQNGYTASSPTNDRGTIAPTAAISSLPFSPAESMRALRFFYYVLGDKLWGEYGFYDAFNLTSLWFADSYLAIDQGPIVCMIENHRTGLLWNLLMANPDVQLGLNKLAFTY